MAVPAKIKDVLDGTGFGDAQLDVLRRIVGAEDDNELALRLEMIRSLALMEWLEWATARRRFSSLSELDTSRVLKLFVNVRKRALSVESLVEDLAIPQARATNMIGRLKYGEARALASLSFAAAVDDVKKRLDDAEERSGRKSITTTREIVDRIEEVHFGILSSPPKELDKRGKYAAAEGLTVASSNRYGSTVTTSTKTWTYIISALESKANAGNV